MPEQQPEPGQNTFPATEDLDVDAPKDAQQQADAEEFVAPEADELELKQD